MTFIRCVPERHHASRSAHNPTRTVHSVLSDDLIVERNIPLGARAIPVHALSMSDGSGSKRCDPCPVTNQIPTKSRPAATTASNAKLTMVKRGFPVVHFGNKLYAKSRVGHFAALLRRGGSGRTRGCSTRGVTTSTKTCIRPSTMRREVGREVEISVAPWGSRYSSIRRVGSLRRGGGPSIHVRVRRRRHRRASSRARIPGRSMRSSAARRVRRRVQLVSY